MRRALAALFLLLSVCLVAASPGINGDFPFFVGPNTAQLVVHPAQTFGPSSSFLAGGDLLSGSSNIALTGTSERLTRLDSARSRYPQGTVGNCLDWSANSCHSCAVTQNANSTDAAYISLLGARLGHTIVNEAADPTCTTGNTTANVQGMVNDIIVTHGCPDTQCKYWTIDNEMYNSNANLPFTPPSCPTEGSRAACYAGRFATFRTAMLAQDANILVCPDTDPQHGGPQGGTWDTVVLAQTHDCEDGHYYWTTPGNETDAGALNAPITDFTANFMAQFLIDRAAGSNPTAPMIIGEYSTIPSSYSYQTQSIIQALFNAEMVGECAQDGLTACEFHAAVANCQSPQVRSLYGSWLTFTGSMSLSNGSAGGTCNGVSGQPAAGTVLAPGNGLQVAAGFTQAGETIIKSSYTGNSDVKVYASTYGAGHSLMLINRSQTNTYTPSISIDGVTGGSGTVTTYSKALFDLTNNVTPIWDGPTTTALAPWTTSFSVTLAPWSATVVHTFPGATPTPSPSPTPTLPPSQPFVAQTPAAQGVGTCSLTNATAALGHQAAAGDVLVLYVLSSTTGTLGMPAGWTLEDTQTNSFHFLEAYFVSTGSDGTTFNFTDSVANGACASFVLDVSQANNFTPFDVHSANLSTLTGTTGPFTTNAGTPTQTNDLPVAFLNTGTSSQTIASTSPATLVSKANVAQFSSNLLADGNLAKRFALYGFDDDDGQQRLRASD